MKLILNFENKTSIKIEEKELIKTAKKVLEIFGQKSATISVSLFLTDKTEIQKINRECRNLDKPTDVISFRLLENPENLPLTKQFFPLEFDKATKTIYFGEIFVCVQVASEQAKEYNHSTIREIFELFVHGMLHILGCDHHETEETIVMRNFEEEMQKFLDAQKIF